MSDDSVRRDVESIEGGSRHADGLSLNPGQRRLVSSAYTAPMPVGQWLVASHERGPAARASARRQPWRKWVLISAACLLGVLLVAAVAAAVLQHRDADSWSNKYSVELSKYHAEVKRNAALFASLVITKQRLSIESNQKKAAQSQIQTLAGAVTSDLRTCVDDTGTVSSEVASSVSAGHVLSALESDATTAGDVCGQAQSENSSLQTALSGG